MPSYLSEIVAAHRRSAAADGRDPDALLDEALGAAAPLGFADAIRRAGVGSAAGGVAGLAVVAEVKRRSPSRGDLVPDLDPAAVAADYAAGGAACLSVLTDAEYFGGSPEDLGAAKRAAGVPVLRKDFTVSPADVCDARLIGADAVLLIVAALDAAELSALLALAGRLDLDALVEVHDEGELERALAAGARLVGVNQRDLATFALDHDRAVRLASAIPLGTVAIAESGVRSVDDARRLADAGYDAVLVGELAVTARDRRAAVHELVGHPVTARPGVVRPDAPERDHA